MAPRRPVIHSLEIKIFQIIRLAYIATDSLDYVDRVVCHPFQYIYG
jgi:hypothetical protein